MQFRFILVASLVACMISESLAKNKKEWKCRGEKPDFHAVKDELLECKEETEDGGDSGVMIMQLKSCFWDKTGAIVDGQYSEQAFKDGFIKVFPKNGQEMADAVVEACVTGKPTNIENLSRNDDSKSYAPLVQCVMQSVHQFCTSAK